MKRLTMLLAAALLIEAPAAHAAPQVQSYDVAVALQSGKAVQKYHTSALVVSFPANYRAQIVYVGGKRAYSGTYNDLPELMASAKTGLVMNGGFYTTDPASPSGLLLVHGQIISPLSFVPSATLCVDHGGHMKVLRTAALRPVARSIASLCGDGLQTFPIVVNRGANDVNATELGRRPYLRTILGFRRDGSPVAVFFRSPVHLYVAAEFLRTAAGRGTSVQVSGTAGQNVHATGGLGLVDAVNLSGDSDSFAALNGRVLLGDAYRELPSAIVIR